MNIFLTIYAKSGPFTKYTRKSGVTLTDLLIFQDSEILLIPPKVAVTEGIPINNPLVLATESFPLHL